MSSVYLKFVNLCLVAGFLCCYEAEGVCSGFDCNAERARSDISAPDSRGGEAYDDTLEQPMWDSVPATLEDPDYRFLVGSKVLDEPQEKQGDVDLKKIFPGLYEHE